MDRPCNLCGYTNHRLLYPGTSSDQPFAWNEFTCTSPHLGAYDDIYQCSNCGLVFSVPSMTTNNILEKYEEAEDPDYLVEIEQRRWAFNHHLDVIEAHSKRGRLLEVGCHIGLFLEIAQRRGWEAVGLEPSRWAAEYGRMELGVNIIPATLREAHFEPESFNVVTTWDVLEHLADPAGELELMARALKPGGLLALTTINIDSLASKMLRHRWPWLMRMHLYYFTPKTLGQLLKKSGFTVIKITSERRRFRLKYLVERSALYSKALAGLLRPFTRWRPIGERAVVVPFGDVILALARKTRDG